MYPGRRDYGGGYRDDFRSYGRSAGMRGGYDDAEEEYDDGSYGYGNSMGMQAGNTGGRGAEVSNQLNLVAALLAQSLQQQQQSPQPLVRQGQNMLQAAQNFIGRQPQQQQQPYQGFRDNWSSPAASNTRGFARSGPTRGGGRGRPGLLGDGLLAYEGPPVGEVPSLLSMPPLRAGRGMWGGGESRPGSKRRSDDLNETESQKRRKETASNDQNRAGQNSKGVTPKPTSALKDKPTPTSSGSKASTAGSSTKLQPQANKTPVKSASSGNTVGDANLDKAADTSKKVAAVTVKKEDALVQQGSPDVSAAAASALVYLQGKAYGAEYVVPVTGYFCKLCHKFYSNVTAATVAHCQSEQHFEKYKSALIKKAKTLGAVEPASEGNADEVLPAASTSASASNQAEEEAEKQPETADNNTAVKHEPEPESEASEAVPRDGDEKPAESNEGVGNAEAALPDDASAASPSDDKAVNENADEAAGDAPAAECSTPVGKSKLAATDADLDVSGVGSLNESVDEAVEDSPATGRARRGRGRGAAVRRGRK